MWVGLALPLLAFVFYLTEGRSIVPARQKRI
jgi:hypothetical protein